MPKEITHWIIAKKAADCAPEPYLRQVIRDNMSLYLAGAIAVDSPYYVLRGRDKPFFAKAGARLHGMKKESPFASVLRIPDIATGVDENRAMAFTLGALTHVIADRVFHPMVYYLTGDYDYPDAAIRRKAVTLHRLLETWMDVWFAQRTAPEKDVKLFRFAAQNSAEAKIMARLGSALFFGEKQMVKPARVAVLSHTIIQSLFTKPWALKALGFYGRVANRDMGEFMALCYPPMDSKPPSFLSGPIRYKNPVTEKDIAETLEEMEKRAVETCARWFNAIASNFASTRLWETCGHLAGEEPPFAPVHFAPQEQRDELLTTLSSYQTAR
ncbi:MAG: zinc dependent phospholipase C family protein [Nitrospinae bacterium]|nr:zinc dependent phospholipase C family protein [Nitrospinota bacterium]